VQFVLNYEEGGENAVLHGDAGFRTVPVRDVQPGEFPDRHLSMEGIYEYGSRAGVWRHPARVRDARAAADGVRRGMALQRHPGADAAFVELGHEIACHGWRWISYQNVDEATEREHMRLGMQAIEDLTGSGPWAGTPGATARRTRRLVVDDGGFAYDSDYYGDDLPFWMKVRAPTARWCPTWWCPTRWTPTTCALRCPRVFATPTRSSSTCATASTRCMPKAPDRPRMLSIGMHCRLLGRPGRIVALQRFLDHIATHDRVWVCRRIDIARHWKQTHPYEG
jgi:allantoinase